MSTTVPTRRARKKEAMHDTLLEAALSLFDERGFAETTIEDIAERADVAPRTFFRYFANKAAVLQPATAEHLETFRSLLVDAPADEGSLAQLHRALRATITTFHADRNRILLQRRICLEADIDLGADEFAGLWASFEAIIADRFSTDPESDPLPSLYTGVVIGVAAGAVRAWLADDAHGDLGALIDAGFATLRDAAS